MTLISTVSAPFDILAPPDFSASIVPSYPVEIETKKNVLASQSEKGARQVGAKSRAFRFYTLPFKGRKRAEFDTFQPLWEDTYPGWTFEWTNAVFDASGEFYVDSPLTWVPARHNLLDYSLVLKQKSPIATAVPASNELPFLPSYNYDAKPMKEVVVSDAPSGSRRALELSTVLWPFNLTFRSRPLAEVLEMEQFWDYHYPGRPVSYTDPVLNISGLFWVDSNFKWSVRDLNLVDYAFALREVSAV